MRTFSSVILLDGTHQRTKAFSAFLSHYLIKDYYGCPGKGNDKGKVEGMVGYTRRNFMLPLPRFDSLDDFNDYYLEAQCKQRQGDILRGQPEIIGQRLERDLAAIKSLPAIPVRMRR